MTDPTKEPVAEKVPAGNATPAPTGGKPDPKPAVPAQPSPEAEPKPGATPPEGAKPQVVPLPALQEERGKRQQLESEVADLRRIVAETQIQQRQVPQQQQPQVDPREELEKTWEEDPKKAVRMEIMYAMDWRDKIDSSLEVQADELARKYPDFNNYRSVSLGQVRSLPLTQRGGPGILEAAYFMVRGQNADTMIQQRETELLEKYKRGEITAQGLATPPGSFSSPTQEPGTPLTPEQLGVANAMGLTPEEYIAGQQVPK